MTVHTFYLQINGNEKNIATKESELPRLRLKERWELYTLSIEDGKISSVSIKSSFLPPQKFTKTTHNRQGVKLHSTTVVIGSEWTKIQARSRSQIIHELRHLISTTLVPA